MIPASRRSSFLNQSLSKQTGSLSANLARIASIAPVPATDAVQSLIDESIAFIEWVAPSFLDKRLDDAAYLVDAQRSLAHWKRVWNSAHTNPVQRQKLAEQAREWSVEILYMSGLVDE